MFVGKSHFMMNFVEKSIFSYRNQIDIWLLSPTADSAQGLRNICQRRGFTFCYFNKIPDIQDMEQNDETKHKILILEDMTYLLSIETNEYIGKLCSFLLRSRHLGISLINILHDYKFGNKLSFQKVFLQNASMFALFSLKNNKNAAITFLKDHMGKKAMKLIDDIFNFCIQSSDFPYLFLDPSFTLGDNYHLSQLRTDIFNHNYVFYRDY